MAAIPAASAPHGPAGVVWQPQLLVEAGVAAGPPASELG